MRWATVSSQARLLPGISFSWKLQFAQRLIGSSERRIAWIADNSPTLADFNRYFIDLSYSELAADRCKPALLVDGLIPPKPHFINN